MKPKTSLLGGCLIIDTPLVARILSLGFYRRTVVVDPGASTITFKTRLLGKNRERTVGFSEISRLDYSYDDTGINTGSAWLGSQDTIEWYTLGIVLKQDREEIKLGRFIGEGCVDHGWEGVLAGDDVFDYRGDQQEHSLGLVKLLQAMTGLPLT